MIAFLPNTTAIVYTSDPTTGAFSVVANAALACRLVPLSAPAAAPYRAEGVDARHFQWDPAYELSGHAQVEIDGVRWSPVVGTLVARAPFGPILVRSCDVVRG